MPTTEYDTNLHIIGAAALQWDWWEVRKIVEPGFDAPESDFDGWYYEVHEIDDDGPTDKHIINHAAIMRGARKIMSDKSYGPDLRKNCSRLVFGDFDEIDFDASTADVVIQVGLFGDVRYG